MYGDGRGADDDSPRIEPKEEALADGNGEARHGGARHDAAGRGEAGHDAAGHAEGQHDAAGPDAAGPGASGPDDEPAAPGAAGTGDGRIPAARAASGSGTRTGSRPGAGAGPGSEQELRERIGRSIRMLRQRSGLTLVQLAALADLSHSFLSQLERGLARPSMASLHRIAEALGTTQIELMSMDTGAASPDPAAGDGAGRTAGAGADPATSDHAASAAGHRVSLVRADGGALRPTEAGIARPLVTGTRAMYPVLFEGAPTEYAGTYTHPGDEFVFVMSGRIEVEVAGEGRFTLGAGDTLYYPGVLPHRWRRLPGPTTSRVLLVQESRSPTH